MSACIPGSEQEFVGGHANGGCCWQPIDSTVTSTERNSRQEPVNSAVERVGLALRFTGLRPPPTSRRSRFGQPVNRWHANPWRKQSAYRPSSDQAPGHWIPRSSFIGKSKSQRQIVT